MKMLQEIMPRLAGRLASAYPELGVRKFRLRLEGERSGSHSLPVSTDLVEEEERSDAGSAPATAGRQTEEAEPALPTEERLRRLVRRYLKRAGQRRSGTLNLTE
jgi:hypothetical protein